MVPRDYRVEVVNPVDIPIDIPPPILPDPPSGPHLSQRAPVTVAPDGKITIQVPPVDTPKLEIIDTPILKYLHKLLVEDERPVVKVSTLTGINYSNLLGFYHGHKDIGLASTLRLMKLYNIHFCQIND